MSAVGSSWWVATAGSLDTSTPTRAWTRSGRGWRALGVGVLCVVEATAGSDRESAEPSSSRSPPSLEMLLHRTAVLLNAVQDLKGAKMTTLWR